MTITSATPPTEQHTTPFSYDWYAQAVRRQHDINAGAPGTQNDRQRVFPAGLAETIYPGLTHAGNSQGDPYWRDNQTSTQGQVLIARHWTQKAYTGELYTTSGFTGGTRYSIKKDNSFEPVYVVRGPNYEGGS